MINTGIIESSTDFLPQYSILSFSDTISNLIEGLTYNWQAAAKVKYTDGSGTFIVGFSRDAFTQVIIKRGN